VFFYDGDHSYISQFCALHLIRRHLSAWGLVVVDDTAWAHVRAATRLFAAFDPALRLVFDIPSPYNGEPRWWNGIQVYECLRGRKRALTARAELRPACGRPGAAVGSDGSTSPDWQA
jgi:hypothetical protein